jgi:NAD(P)-dependent dehydrogenase (short-subunit alcohol dehydrogenase family)
MLLKDRTAIITGAVSPRGLGKASARRFVEEGARVAIFDLDAEAASSAAKSLGVGNMCLACDVRDPARCKAAVEEVIKHFGAVDILVNNAGVSQPDKLMEISQENFNLVIDVSLRGSLNMVQAVAPGMQSRRRGSIISIGSVAAQIGGPLYSAAKGGVHSLTKSMARELAAFNIRANAIAPGTIDTDIFAGSSRTRRPASWPTFRSAGSGPQRTSPTDVSTSPQISRPM